MKHLELDNLSLDQLVDKLIVLVSPLQGFLLRKEEDDENISALRWTEDIYRRKTAARVAEEITSRLVRHDSPVMVSDQTLAKIFLGCSNSVIYNPLIKPRPSGEVMLHLYAWLNEDEPGINNAYIAIPNAQYEYASNLVECEKTAIHLVHIKIPTYEYRCALQIENAKRDFREAQDLCKTTEWEDRKLTLKNENLDSLKANHFGKFFYEEITFPDSRFHYAMETCYGIAAAEYLKEDLKTNIPKKIDDFFYLQAMYCLLHDEDPVPPCFREQSQPVPASSPAATAAEENQQPTVPTEERKHRLGLYIGLAQTSMALRDNILQAIRKVFDPGNESLWDKIAEDRQNPLPYTDHDHTDLTPFFNLLGVLIRKGLLPKGKEWTAILDKLPNDFHSKNKDAIKTAVTNGSRTEPKPLARSIEHCLDPQ